MNEARARSERRLNRRELWASLWLKRIFAFLDIFNGERLSPFWRRRADIWLRHIAGAVLDIILSRALLRLQLQNRRGHARTQISFCAASVSFRRLIGGALRRALKAKTLKARAQNMLRILQMAEALAEKLARRLRRGLSRAAAASTRAAIGGDVVIAPALFAVMCARADTS